MKLGWLLATVVVVGGGYYYYWKHHPVTQLQSGSKYQLTGAQVPVIAASQLPGWQGTAVILNTDGSAVMTGTYTGQAIPVPYGLTATPG